MFYSWLQLLLLGVCRSSNSMKPWERSAKGWLHDIDENNYYLWHTSSVGDFLRKGSECPVVGRRLSKKEPGRSLTFGHWQGGRGLCFIEYFPEHKARAVDLSQNFNFTELAPYVPCLTPRGEKYITSRCRPLLGLESLRLQGLWVGDESDPEDFYAGMSEALLKDLAGNAFESSCFAAAFWCTLRLNACVHRLQEPIQIPRTLAPELEDGPESDSDVRTSYSDATTLRYGETRRSKKKWGHTLRSYF